MAWVVYGVRWVWLGARGLLQRWRKCPAWVQIVVEGPLPNFDPPRGPFWRRLLTRRPAPSLYELDARVRRLAREPRVRGVVIHLRAVPLAPAQVEALVELVSRLKAAQKRVVCWATGYTAGSYQVACAADEVLLQPGGGIGQLGLARTYLFLKEALDRVGVEPDFIQVSPYKTAADTLTQRSLTPAAREMAEWLADAELTERSAAIAGGRGLGEAEAQALLDGSPHTDTQALEVGAVDAVCSEEALPERLGSEPVPWDSARRRLWCPPPVPPGPRVGLLRIEGAIVDGHSQRPPVQPPGPLPALLQERAGDLDVVRQARRLARTRRVAAVVLWIDSPGGSASASEAMAAALEVLASRKPLVAVMGAVAASGGYYVATPARRIFGRPGTLTGSIGVLGGKLAVGGLLRRLLVGREVVARGAHAGMDDPGRPYSEEERAKAREGIDRCYAVFLDRVAKSRGRPLSEIESIAGGRVWTGRQALHHGLLDELGGLDRALAEARRLGKLRDDVPLVELPDRGPVAPAPTNVAALALDTLRALALAPAWLLCPLLDIGLLA